MDAMGHLVDDLIARTHELLQPNPGQLNFDLFGHHLMVCQAFLLCSWMTTSLENLGTRSRKF